VLVAFGTTFTMAPLSELVSHLAPMARASALAAQGFSLDMGAAVGAAVSARIGYTELCGFLAVGMAAGALLVNVTAEPVGQPSTAPRPDGESHQLAPTGPAPVPPVEAASAGDHPNGGRD
jgi:hypothetical protein